MGKKTFKNVKYLGLQTFDFPCNIESRTKGNFILTIIKIGQSPESYYKSSDSLMSSGTARVILSIDQLFLKHCSCHLKGEFYLCLYIYLFIYLKSCQQFRLSASDDGTIINNCPFLSCIWFHVFFGRPDSRYPSDLYSSVCFGILSSFHI